MKKYFYFFAAITALAFASCRKIEVDGSGNGGENGGGSGNGKTVVLENRITTNTTLRKGDENILKGKVYITNGVTLTIEPGAVVKGNFTGSDVAVLIVARGGKIVAEGTPTEPIVFTSSSPNPQSGDWGGIVLCGKAPINQTYLGTQGLFEIEGGINNAQLEALCGSGDAVAPQPVPDDSSGVLKYVRIEYAGYAFQPNLEVNSLTLGAVGNRTVIDHVQVSYAKDDAFEWFGGTVNCKHLIAYRTQDDDFDTDNGYSGTVQFGLIVRDSSIADISKSEAFESDNNSSGGTVTPQTKAVFCNISAFGPLATLENSGNSNYHGAAVQIRRNSSISIFNSAFVGWSVGIELDASTGRPVDLNITDGILDLSGIFIAGCRKPIAYKPSTTQPTGATEASLTAWFNNNTLNHGNMTLADIRLIKPFDYAAPDWMPFGTSPLLLSGADVDNYFSRPILAEREFIEKVPFIGAIGGSGEHASWHKGWTKFN